MNSKYWKVLNIIVFLFIVLMTASITYRCSTKNNKVETVHITDTIVKRKIDSVYYNKFIQLPGKIDTVFIFNTYDSLIVSGYIHDTVYIENLQLKLITRDTIIKDSILIEKYITNKPKHFGFGITAGISGTCGCIHKQFDVGPSVTLGITYKF